jgi:hypothetical protein
MERVVLGIILVSALAYLVWMVLRQIRSASGRVSNPACAGCPFEPKCEMQERRDHEPDAGQDRNGSDLDRDPEVTNGLR